MYGFQTVTSLAVKLVPLPDIMSLSVRGSKNGLTIKGATKQPKPKQKWSAWRKALLDFPHNWIRKQLQHVSTMPTQQPLKKKAVTRSQTLDMTGATASKTPAMPREAARMSWTSHILRRRVLNREPTARPKARPMIMYVIWSRDDDVEIWRSSIEGPVIPSPSPWARNAKYKARVLTNLTLSFKILLVINCMVKVLVFYYLSMSERFSIELEYPSRSHSVGLYTIEKRLSCENFLRKRLSDCIVAKFGLQDVSVKNRL